MTSGPAEMNSLVRPVAYRAALAFSAADIWVFASPGSRASARDTRIASAYSGVRRAFTPSESWYLSFMGIRPRGFTVSGRGVVVNLGASSRAAAALATRLRYPLIHYVAREYPVKPRGAALYLVEDERVQAALVAAGAAPASVKVAGDLSLDVVAIAARGSGTLASGRRGGQERLVGLFPGENLREARHMGPFMLRAAELLARVERGTSFMMRVSPFVGTASLDSIVKLTPTSARSEGTSAAIDRTSVPFALITADGVRVPVDPGPDHSSLHDCDVVLTVPGPICHELAYVGVPYIVVAPRGLTPGRAGRRTGQARESRESGLLALRSHPKGSVVPVSGPNMKAGRIVAREVVGAVRPEDVVIPVVEMMGDHAACDRIVRELREVVGLPGAAGAVIQSIYESMPG